MHGYLSLDIICSVVILQLTCNYNYIAKEAQKKISCNGICSDQSDQCNVSICLNKTSSTKSCCMCITMDLNLETKRKSKQYLLFLQNGIPEVNCELSDVNKAMLVGEVIIQTKNLHKRVLHEGDDGPGLWRHELGILHKIHVQLLKNTNKQH